jgi:hypothetical protein
VVIPDYDAVFRPGQIFRFDQERMVVRVTELGFVDAPTGSLLVFDPFLYDGAAEDGEDDEEPNVPLGRHRVQRSDGADDGFSALAVRVVLADRPAVRWEYIDELVSVDTATIAIADSSLLPALAAMGQDLREAVMGDCDPGIEFALGRGKAIAFSTRADGGYQLAWGFDADDEPVALVVDMGGLWCEHEDSMSLPATELSRTGRVKSDWLDQHNLSLEVLKTGARELTLRVEGYEKVTRWELRAKDDTRLNHSKLYERHKQVLSFQIPGSIPEGARLHLGIVGAPLPMQPEGIEGWLSRTWSAVRARFARR